MTRPRLDHWLAKDRSRNKEFSKVTDEWLGGRKKI